MLRDTQQGQEQGLDLLEHAASVLSLEGHRLDRVVLYTLDAFVIQ